MEGAVVVATQIQPLHAAGQVGGFIRGLGIGAVRQRNARHADGGQQQEEEQGDAFHGRQMAMIQGIASTISTRPASGARNARSVPWFQCWMCSGKLPQPRTYL